MPRLKVALIDTSSNHIESKHKFQNKDMQALSRDPCNNRQNLKIISCASTIQVNILAETVRLATSIAPANLITYFFLPQIYSVTRK